MTVFLCGLSDCKSPAQYSGGLVVRGEEYWCGGAEYPVSVKLPDAR